MLRKIYLYGNLANDFGDCWELDVKSIGEACRAIEANHPGFLNTIRQMDLAVARGDELDSVDNLDLAGCFMEFESESFHIAPAIAGDSFWSGWGSVIVGGLMVVAGAIMAYTGWGAAFAPYLISTGIGLMGFGAANLLTPIQQTPKSAESDPSYLFQSPSNKTTQGLPIALAYGEVVLGSIVISDGIRVIEA